MPTRWKPQVTANTRTRTVILVAGTQKFEIPDVPDVRTVMNVIYKWLEMVEANAFDQGVSAAMSWRLEGDDPGRMAHDDDAAQYATVPDWAETPIDEEPHHSDPNSAHGVPVSEDTVIPFHQLDDLGYFRFGCDYLVDDASSFDPFGVALLSLHSLPSCNAIFKFDDSRCTVSLEHLHEYLSFLETLILYDELIIAHVPIRASEADARNEDSVLFRSTGFFDYDGPLRLRPALDDLVSSSGFISDVAFDISNAHEPTLGIARTLLDERSSQLELFPEHKYYKLTDLYRTMYHDSISIAVTQLSSHLHVPYYGSNVLAHNYLKSRDAQNAEVEKAILSYMQSASTSGASEIVESIQRFGPGSTYAPTPLSAMLLSSAATVEELLPRALDLRDKYKAFRQRVLALERKLLDPDLSIKDRTRTVQEIDRISEELWGGERSGLRKTIAQYGSYIDSVVSQVNGDISIKKLTELLLAKPIDWLLAQVRRRDYRLLFHAKKAFLRQPSLQSQLHRLLKPYGADHVELKDTLHTLDHYWR